MARRPTLEEILDSHHAWYHTIDLAEGVTTPGWTDVRSLVKVSGIPARLDGKRALDCGTFDGFWAFEMERRGAQVVAIDIDEIPPPDTPRIHKARLTEEAAGVTPGTGFGLLKRWFGSSVERVSCDIRKVNPSVVGGPVDFAFIGALLLHIRDPLSALDAVWDTLRPGGEIVLFEPVSKTLADEPPAAEFRAYEGAWTYWYPNRGALRDWLLTAGFVDVTFGQQGAGDDRHGGNQLVVSVRGRKPTDAPA